MRMKKVLLLVFTFLTLTIFSFDSFKSKIVDTCVASEELECRFRQCHATAKSTGKRCKHCVSKEYDYYCWQHKD